LNTILSNSETSIKINSKGAELLSFKNNSSDREYIWEGNPVFWGKHSPVLFPIVGSLKNNSFYHIDSVYNLSRHGFARDNEFKTIYTDDQKIIFSLIASEETLKVYPFQFELQLSYILQNKKLIVGYKVINRDSQKIPFSIGGHPAFALPGLFENYSLVFEYPEILECFSLENDLISNHITLLKMHDNKIPLSYDLFKKDALILKKLKSKKITILEKDNPILDFTFDNFPNFGIWTKDNAPFICLEPWFGYSDTIKATGNLFEKEGILTLDPGKHFECQFSIEIL
jgi:galactose mutarotase-like enzyme